VIAAHRASARVAALVFALALAAICLVAGGCSSRCFRSPSQLSGFRVFGVVIEPPSAAVGEPVTLTLASADVRPRAIQVQWHRCPRVPSASFFLADSAATASADLDACFRTEPFATGTTVTLPMPPPGPPVEINLPVGQPDAGVEIAPDGSVTFRLPDGGVSFVPPRLQLPMISAAAVAGFACAGGTIGPPSARSAWPTCNGPDATGWAFTRMLVPNTPDSPLAPLPAINPRIAAVRMGPAQGADRGEVITAEQPPVVPRCATPDRPDQCSEFAFRLDLEPSLSPDVPADVRTFGSLIDGATPSNSVQRSTSGCPAYPSPDTFGVTRWLPPSQPGVVRVVLMVWQDVRGFAWTERQVVVQ
jgi:hypothetical protein